MAAEVITIPGTENRKLLTVELSLSSRKANSARCCAPQGSSVLSAIPLASSPALSPGSNCGKWTGRRHIFGAGSQTLLLLLATSAQIATPPPVFIAVRATEKSLEGENRSPPNFSGKELFDQTSLIGLKKCIGFPILNKNMKLVLKSHRVLQHQLQKRPNECVQNQSQQSFRPLSQAARQQTHLFHTLLKEAAEPQLN